MTDGLLRRPRTLNPRAVNTLNATVVPRSAGKPLKQRDSCAIDKRMTPSSIRFRKGQLTLFGIMSPGKQLLRSQILATNHLGKDNARLHAFDNDLTLALSRPFAPTYIAIDHLEPTDLSSISPTTSSRIKGLSRIVRPSALFTLSSSLPAIIAFWSMRSWESRRPRKRLGRARIPRVAWTRSSSRRRRVKTS